jgi:hypothetical protein
MACGCVAAYARYWVVDLGPECNDTKISIYLSWQGVCRSVNGGNRECFHWQDVKKMKDNVEKSVEDDYLPAFALNVASFSFSAVLFLLCSAAIKIESVRVASQIVCYLGCLIITALMIAAISVTYSTPLTNARTFDSGCTGSTSYPSTGYVFGCLGWILAFLTSIVFIFPPFRFLLAKKK